MKSTIMHIIANDQSILTDGVHMMTPIDLDVLHAFCVKKLGMRRRWFQEHDRHPHYDITSKRLLAKALKAGAILTTTKDMLRVCGRVTLMTESEEER